MSEVFNSSVLDAINRAVQDGISTTALEVDGTPQYCIINAETREIEIPGELNIFGVESDEKSTRVYFRCPKYVGTNVDLDMTQCMVYVPYRNANGEKDQYIVTDLNETEDGENVEFTWLISRKASAYMGITEFGIRAIKTAVGGTIEAEWNTTVASANVLRGMDVGLLEFSEENKDALAQALDLINQELEQTKNEMNSEIETKGQQTLATIPDDYTTAAQNALSAKNEVEDIRVGYTGIEYESAGESVRNQISILSNNSKINSFEWEEGNINNTNGENTSSSLAIRTKKFYETKKIRSINLRNSDNVEIRIIYYSLKNGEYIYASRATYNNETNISISLNYEYFRIAAYTTNSTKLQIEDGSNIFYVNSLTGIHVFNNVEDMKLNKDILFESDIVITSGYYFQRDGGGAVYVIKNLYTGQKADPRILKIDNEKYAFLIETDKYNAKKLGCATKEISDLVCSTLTKETCNNAIYKWDDEKNKAYIDNSYIIRSLLNRVHEEITGSSNDDGENQSNQISCIPVTIYFPTGYYIFKSSIIFLWDENKGGALVNLIGDNIGTNTDGWSTPHKNNEIYTDITYNKYGSTVFDIEISSNTVFITNYNPSLQKKVPVYSYSIKGISFVSSSGALIINGTANHTGNNNIPFDVYEYYSKISNVSCLNISVGGPWNGIQAVIEDCDFQGFSGTAITIYGAKSTCKNCKFLHCGTGISIKNHDSNLYSVFISFCEIGIKVASTIFAYSLWIDQCSKYAIQGINQIKGFLQGLIDHINYASIYAPKITELFADLKIGRCGMHYAGCDIEDIEDIEELSKGTFICANEIFNNTFILQSNYRSIVDTDADNVHPGTPNIYFSGEKWNDNFVIGLTGKEYTMFSNSFKEKNFKNPYPVELN